MKHFFAFTLISLTFTSCYKDYTCKCTEVTSDLNQIITGEVQYDYHMNKYPKKEAEEKCNKVNEIKQQEYTQTVTNCQTVLK